MTHPSCSFGAEPPNAEPERHLSADAVARIGLACTAGPGDPLAGRLLQAYPAAEIWSAVCGGSALDPPDAVDPSVLRRRMAVWRNRAPQVCVEDLLALAEHLGARLVLPGTAEWPVQLDTLGEYAPYALWVRGQVDLRYACSRSVAIVGARAASDYGMYVAAEIACGLAERQWSIVSGGAYGIDAAAHRGALAGRAPTVVVLACGLDISYPRGHENLFAEVALRGCLISEWPPGSTPTKSSFLVRNRVIAALAPGTAVVEAGLRSGAINTARHARELNRVLMAVPGPVTSTQSAGSHMLLRDWQAGCVTDATDVIEQVGRIGDDLQPQRQRGPVVARESLDALSVRLLNVLPRKVGAGTATVAAAADVDLDTAMRRLGLLAAGGFAERCATGWRVKP